MARKRKYRRRGAEKPREIEVSDGVKQSIIAVLLALLGILILLSYFKLAGTFGTSVDDALALVFGWDRWIFGFALFFLGLRLILPLEKQISVWTGIGVALFFLSFNGIINLFKAASITEPSLLAPNGGLMGILISSVLVQYVGIWGAGAIALGLLIISGILISHVSLQTVFSFPKHLTSMNSAMKRTNGDDEDEEEEIPRVFVGDVDADADSKEDKKSSYIESTEEEIEEESVMTSKNRRKMEIPFDLLDDKSSEGKSGDVERGQEVIKKTFLNFGIDVEMVDVRTGPAVTQYSLRPAQGIKLSRILGLQNDLALALAAHPIRIEAPIPGKSLVGIEVPNQSVGMVCLREMLESKEFKHRKNEFTSPLGKDVSGVVTSLVVDKAPHTLVAGATGSGKSVCLNVIILSLLYQNGPDDLKLIMIDPKRVELGVYAGIPHLLVPPITKVDEAINALKWAVREMERRLDHLAKFGARDIDAYNKKSEERMPKIFIIIDELADLMSQNKRDVEAVIVRIAQMARAAGIHLVLATQRPSVDVITGLIKANIPTRLAFAVASQVDSKTILDISGAEKLLGRGDMLLSTPELSKPKRLQGAYVSDEEIERVIKFLKAEGEPDYNYQVTEDVRTGGSVFSSEDSDPLLDEAIQIVLESGKASTSFLQRRMRIGYSRAARIIDLMEQAGVVGEGQGAKPRELLVDHWPPEGNHHEADVDLPSDVIEEDENWEENEEDEQNA
ncbi:MAG: DNA translocase FtsK 4TM domain-containing protein [Patescibacteria group bacterium]|jgi:S-DNA-T family DNA segregation ATPase FtsK/SpoIIIE